MAKDSDRKDLVESTLEAIRSVEEAMAEVARNGDSRTLGSIAKGYRDLLSLHSRLAPDTPYDAAARMTELGLDATDVGQAIIRKYQLRS